ncbi:hypothetical protein Tco_0492490 [Tanacetum coccineum]
MYRPPSEPSHQEEFEHIVLKFIFDQEKRIRQIEDYMEVITDEFMEFSPEVARRLKERIKENENKPRKIKKIMRYPDTKVLENSAKHNFFKNLEKKTIPTLANLLCVRYVWLVPSNPSQPQKNTLGFKPGKRANQSYHNLSSSLTVQLPTRSDPTFVDNYPIKHNPSPHCSFTHVESNYVFDPGGKTHDLSLKGSHGRTLVTASHAIGDAVATAMSKRARNTRGQDSSSREETIGKKVRKFGLFDSKDHQMNYNNLVGRSIHLRDVVDWDFLSNQGLAQSFFDSINTNDFFKPQWVNLFQINEPIFRKLVRKFFSSFEFDASPCRYDPLHKGVTFRLGGVKREMPLLELGWRVGLYSERKSKDVATLSGLRNVEIVNATCLTHLFWHIIGDGGYNIGNTKAKSIRNPRIKLAHPCITMTITGRKETTNRVTEINLLYLQGRGCLQHPLLARQIPKESNG